MRRGPQILASLTRAGHCRWDGGHGHRVARPGAPGHPRDQWWQWWRRVRRHRRRRRSRPVSARVSKLAALGLRAVVLEARDRIGGRCYCDNTFPAPFDFGGQFFQQVVPNALRRHEQPALRSLHRARRPGRAVRARARLLRERRAPARCRASALPRHVRPPSARSWRSPARPRSLARPTFGGRRSPPTSPASPGTRSRPRSSSWPSMRPASRLSVWILERFPVRHQPRRLALGPSQSDRDGQLHRPIRRAVWTSGSRPVSPKST